MPPDLRLSKISTNRKAVIEFTNEMSLPDTAEFIKLNEASDLRLLDVKMISGES